jgi:hypothetical protein
MFDNHEVNLHYSSQTLSKLTLNKDMKLYLANDWNLKEETPEYFLLMRNTASTSVHILLALFFCWMIFIPNIIYHFSKKEKKKILK